MRPAEGGAGSELDRLPAELRACNQWVCWRRESREGKDTKVPCSAKDGRLASVREPSSWSSFEVAKSALKDRGFDGLGFVFTAADPYCGIDLDSALDGERRPKAWAKEILKLLPAGAYIEVSPSGRGLHVILRGSKPGSRAKRPVGDGAVEIYDQLRYFTMTGDCFAEPAADFACGQSAVDAIYARLFANDAGGDRADREAGAGAVDPGADLPEADRRMLEKAFASARGSAIRALWVGDITGYESQSEADLALCSHLFYWIGDDRQLVDSLFRRSGLMREKWELEQYRERTLTKAAQKCGREPAAERPGSKAPAQSEKIWAEEPPDRLPRKSKVPEGKADPQSSSTSSPKSATAEMTQLGNAHRLAARFGDRLRFVPGLGYLVFQEGRWIESRTKAEGLASQLGRMINQEAAEVHQLAAEAQDPELRRSLQTKARSLSTWALKSEQGSMIRESLKLAEPLLELSPLSLDADPHLLNVQNGTLNLKTGRLHRHKPKDFLTRIAPWQFKAGAAAPRWARFVDEIMGGSADKVRYLQKALGYSATGLVGEQCLFICYGTGQNGKSTLLEVVARVLGPGYVSRPASDFLTARRESAHPSAIAKVRGARLVVCQEVGTEKIFDAQRLKELTGERTLTAREMYGDWFEFGVNFKIWLVVNHLPRTEDNKPAFWRRIRLIRFLHSIKSPVRDLDLQLTEEAPGILSWLAEGARLYLEEGLEPPEEVKEAGREYRLEADTIARFVAECCELGERHKARASDLQNRYEAFARDQGFSPVSRNKFGPALESQGFVKARRKDAVFYTGLATRPNATSSGDSTMISGDGVPGEPR
jgi:putative DNA primase/helicase